MDMQENAVLVPAVADVEEPVASSAGTPPAGVDRGLVARLVGDAQRDGVAIDGEGGLLAELTRLVLESALEGELTAHLGYEKHARADGGDGNARNGTRGKRVLTKAGLVQIEVPRDRAGTFQPAIVRKRQRRLGSIEDIVLSLSARGMTHGDISAHLADVYGSDVSKTTISTITDKVLEGMTEWQSRPLDPVYPVVFVDAIHVKVRDGQVGKSSRSASRRSRLLDDDLHVGVFGRDALEDVSPARVALTEGLDDVAVARVGGAVVPAIMTGEYTDRSYGRRAITG